MGEAKDSWMQVRDAGWARQLKPWGMPLLIVGLVVACYSPALTGGMLWDDPAHVIKPALRSWEGLVRIWAEPRATQQYYPVLFTAFWIEHRLWGDHTLGYHLVNVVLHATSCCLLAALLRRLWAMPDAWAGPGGTGARRIPPGTEWLAALLFAVHPLCVESVAWISEQKNTLSLVFYLLAAWAFLDFASTRRWRSYGLASVLFLLALGSKTVTATLPAALLVILWWKRGRISWRNDVVPLIPWFVASLVMGLFTSWFERHWIGAEGADFALGGPQRVLLAGRVLWFYFGKVVWPSPLLFFYPRWDVPAVASGWTMYVLAGVGVTAGLWMWRRRGRGPLAAWLFFGGSLFPALGFFNVYPFLFSYVADHFQYLASMGLIAALVGGGAVLVAGKPRWLRTSAAMLAVVVVVTFAAMSHRQSRLYRDNETLFRATVAGNPSSWMAHQILATTLSKTPDRHQEALEEFREVIRLKPDHPDAHFGLGVELARLPGQQDAAIAEYQRAIELRPFYAEAHNNLGLELAKVPGRSAEALTHFESALQARPDYAEAHANLADVLVRSPDRLPEAMAHYEEALRLNPELAWVHAHFAFQLARLPGRQEEAFAHYREALRLAPDSIDAHNGLAIAYIASGRLADARKEWETVLRIDPRQAAARRNLQRLDEMEAR